MSYMWPMDTLLFREAVQAIGNDSRSAPSSCTQASSRGFLFSLTHGTFPHGVVGRFAPRPPLVAVSWGPFAEANLVEIGRDARIPPPAHFNTSARIRIRPSPPQRSASLWHPAICTRLPAMPSLAVGTAPRRLKRGLSNFGPYLIAFGMPEFDRT